MQSLGARILLRRTLRGQAKRHLGIYGHTDDTETAAHNLDLSRRRAEAVRAALAPLLGAGWTFDVQGFGETGRSPRTRRTTGRRTPRGARNRRVEIAVLS
jgi:outer membrane protein OmpA-like peptidoglycan-associated protein